MNISQDSVWAALREVHDPEIPVLSLIDLKIVRDVRIEGEAVTVTITPTFVGCPALEQMKTDIRSRLEGLGISDVRISTDLSLPWSTDHLEPEAREKLRAFGIAPPPARQQSLAATIAAVAACPFCGSEKTHLESPFGPTLCRQVFYCDSCRQSFERFKPL